MPRSKGYRLRDVPQRERNLRGRGGTQRGSDTRDYGYGNSVAGEGRDFLAAASEDEGISAFQTSHFQARRACSISSSLIRVLREVDSPTSLPTNTRVASRRARSRMAGATRRSYSNTSARLQQLQGAQSEQIRIPRAGPDQIDLQAAGILACGELVQLGGEGRCAADSSCASRPRFAAAPKNCSQNGRRNAGCNTRFTRSRWAAGKAGESAQP